MKRHVTSNGVLLQNGRHLGIITEAEYISTERQFRLTVFFEQADLRLHHRIHIADISQVSNLRGIATGIYDINSKDIVDADLLKGEKSWFELDLLMVKTSKGPVGVNMISSIFHYW